MSAVQGGDFSDEVYHYLKELQAHPSFQKLIENGLQLIKVKNQEV